MPITFIPALGDTTRIHIPPWHTTCSHASTVQLQFTAFLDDEEFQQFNNGMKVQIWSNIPSQEQNNGQWDSLDFEIQPEETDISAISLSLGLLSDNSQGGDVKGPLSNEKHALVLYLSIPFSNILSEEIEFSFTYRLLFPSGEQRWLGSYGQNGTLFLENTSNPGDTGFVLAKEGWGFTDLHSGPVWQWHASPDVEGKDLHVAEIPRPQDWTIWGIGKEGTFLLNSSMFLRTPFYILFLVPRVHPFSILRPKTFVLRTSPDNAISICNSNASKQVLSIFASSPGPIFLEAYESVDSLLEKVDVTQLGSLKPLQSSSNHHVVMLWSPPDGYPKSVVILPLLSERSRLSGQPTLLQMKSNSLASSLGHNISRFTLFSPIDLGVHLVDLSRDKDLQLTGTDTSSHVSLYVSPMGAQYILTPLYSIPHENSGMTEMKSTSILKSLQVSVLSPHSIHVIDSSADDCLPTPPPSPHLWPIAHLAPTCEQNLTGSSNTSIPDVVMPNRQDTPSALQATVENESLDMDTKDKIAEVKKPKSGASPDTSEGDGLLREIDVELEEEDASERDRIRSHSPTRHSHPEANSLLTVGRKPGMRRSSTSSASSVVNSVRASKGRFSVTTTLLKGLFRVFKLWLSMLVHSIFRSGCSKSTRAQTDPESRAELRFPDATRDEEDDTLEVQVISPIVDERTPLLSSTAENQGHGSTESHPSPKHENLVQENSTSEATVIVAPQRKNFLVFDLLDPGRGEADCHSMLIRASGNWDYESVRFVVDLLEIQLNGKPAVVSDVKTLELGAVLVKFGEKESGKLRLSFRE